MLEKAADSLKKVLSPISEVLTGISMAVVVIVVLLVVAGVVSRRLFHMPILGAGEISRLAFSLIVFLPLAWGALKGAHIELDLIASKFPKTIRSVIDTVVMVLTIGILGLLSWQLASQGLNLQTSNAKTAVLGIPTFPFAYLATLGSIMLAVAFVIRFLRSLSDTIKGKRQ